MSASHAAFHDASSHASQLARLPEPEARSDRRQYANRFGNSLPARAPGAVFESAWGTAPSRAVAERVAIVPAAFGRAPRAIYSLALEPNNDATGRVRALAGMTLLLPLFPKPAAGSFHSAGRRTPFTSCGGRRG